MVRDNTFWSMVSRFHLRDMDDVRDASKKHGDAMNDKFALAPQERDLVDLAISRLQYILERNEVINSLLTLLTPDRRSDVMYVSALQASCEAVPVLENPLDQFSERIADRIGDALLTEVYSDKVFDAVWTVAGVGRAKDVRAATLWLHARATEHAHNRLIDSIRRVEAGEKPEPIQSGLAIEDAVSGILN